MRLHLPERPAWPGRAVPIMSLQRSSLRPTRARLTRAGLPLAGILLAVTAHETGAAARPEGLTPQEIRSAYHLPASQCLARKGYDVPTGLGTPEGLGTF